jgi:hypothetical protein
MVAKNEHPRGWCSCSFAEHPNIFRWCSCSEKCSPVRRWQRARFDCDGIATRNIALQPHAGRLWISAISGSVAAGEWRCTAIDWAHLPSVAPPNHHFVGKLSPKGSDANIPRYASIRPTQLGSCVDLVPVHEDSAFVLRVFTRGDNERLSYAIE